MSKQTEGWGGGSGSISKPEHIDGPFPICISPDESLVIGGTDHG